MRKLSMASGGRKVRPWFVYVIVGSLLEIGADIEVMRVFISGGLRCEVSLRNEHPIITIR
jgi:hypothetical protein